MVALDTGLMVSQPALQVLHALRPAPAGWLGLSHGLLASHAQHCTCATCLVVGSVPTCSQLTRHHSVVATTAADLSPRAVVLSHHGASMMRELMWGHLTMHCTKL